MFKRITKYIKFLNHVKSQQNSNNEKATPTDEQHIIHKKIELNLTSLRNTFRNSDDIIVREFKFGVKEKTKAFVCFIDGLGNKALINEYIIKPLMIDLNNMDNKATLGSYDTFTIVKEFVLTASEVTEVKSFEKVKHEILLSNTALFIDGYDTIIIVSTKGGKSRAVEEPATEVVVRGPREGFTEILRENTALLRRRILNTNLVFEPLTLGKQTLTQISIAYIEGIANKKIVEEVRKRLNRIDIDSILESGYIEQLIEDNPFSPFATVGNSERPDKIAGKLLEGRVAILCNGTPFVLTVPYLFVETMQITEDYYSRPFLSSFIRMLRLFAFFITVTLPSFYVAVETFHQEMIPTVLLITMAQAREGIPFPSFVETIIMLVIFELLRESGVRLPRQVGQAVSIVGALVIGDAAVKAGIISAPMVIIGSLTAISSFIVPPLLDSIVFFRFFLLFLSAAFGLYGIIVGLVIMLMHMCSLRSFGTPYLSPIAPTIWRGLLDTFIRAPIWLMDLRPRSITWQESRRQKHSLMPKKPDNDGGDAN